MLTGRRGSSLVAVRRPHRRRGLAALAPLIAVAALLLLPAAASATTTGIHGTVTNAATGLPIEGIEVCAEAGHPGKGECASTNPNGEYTISVTANGRYYVEFSGPNYLTQDGELLVEGGSGELNAAMQAVVELSVMPASPVTNEPVVLTATVASSSETGPSGTVDFENHVEGISACEHEPVSLSGSVYTATCHTSFAASTSPESLTAVFTPTLGVGVATPSTSNTVDLTVGKDPTTTALQISNTSPSVGETMTYTATVTPETAGQSVPSGSVEFLDGATPIGTCSAQTLTQGAGVSSSTATCQLSYQSTGTHEITAFYDGDVNFNTSGSGRPQTVTVILPLTTSASGSSGAGREASATDGPLSATAGGGKGTVTVGQYGSDPLGGPTFESSGKYIDVSLASGSTFTSLSFTDCELNDGASLMWWDPQGDNGEGGWEPVLPASAETAPSGSPPCITVTLTEATSPTLEQLTGTVFGVALPPSTSGSTTGGGGSSTTPASTTPVTTTTPATGSVSLDGSAIPVQSSGAAAVKLTCTGTVTCSGELTLTAKSTTKKGKKKKTKTTTIGTAGFSIPAGSTATVKLSLNGAGKALLKAAHGHLSATLTILKSSPSPTQTSTDSVHLSQQKASKAKKGKR